MFSIGDKVTIKRGKDKGQAEVIALADSDGNYVVRTSAGGHRIVKAESLAAPVQPSISESRLSVKIQAAIEDADVGGNDQGHAVSVIKALVLRLHGDLPGLGARLSWPAQEAGE